MIKSHWSKEFGNNLDHKTNNKTIVYLEVNFTDFSVTYFQVYFKTEAFFYIIESVSPGISWLLSGQLLMILWDSHEQFPLGWNVSWSITSSNQCLVCLWYFYYFRTKAEDILIDVQIYTPFIFNFLKMILLLVY